MKKVRVEDAVGMTLCHDLTEMRDGFKGAAVSGVDNQDDECDAHRRNQYRDKG